MNPEFRGSNGFIGDRGGVEWSGEEGRKGLGEVGRNFASINDVAKWILCLAMLLGRLEIFTLLVLITPAFWKK